MNTHLWRWDFFNTLEALKWEAKLNYFLKIQSVLAVRYSSSEILGTVSPLIWKLKMVMPVSYMRWRTVGSSLPKTMKWKYHKTCFMIFKLQKWPYGLFLVLHTDRLLLNSKFVTGLIGAIVCLLICHIHHSLSSTKRKYI